MKLSIVIPCNYERTTVRAIVDAVRAAPSADNEIIAAASLRPTGGRAA